MEVNGGRVQSAIRGFGNIEIIINRITAAKYDENECFSPAHLGIVAWVRWGNLTANKSNEARGKFPIFLLPTYFDMFQGVYHLFYLFGCDVFVPEPVDVR